MTAATASTTTTTSTKLAPVTVAGAVAVTVPPRPRHFDPLIATRQAEANDRSAVTAVRIRYRNTTFFKVCYNK